MIGSNALPGLTVPVSGDWSAEFFTTARAALVARGLILRKISEGKTHDESFRGIALPCRRNGLRLHASSQSYSGPTMQHRSLAKLRHRPRWKIRPSGTRAPGLFEDNQGSRSRTCQGELSGAEAPFNTRPRRRPVASSTMPSLCSWSSAAFTATAGAFPG